MWTLRATVWFVETDCLHIYVILVFLLMSLVPFESNLNIGPYLNFMLEVLPLFMFQFHFEIPTHSKPMEVAWSEALQTFACPFFSIAFSLFFLYSIFFPLLSVPGYIFLWVLCGSSLRFERTKRCAQVIERIVEGKLEQKRLILVLNQVMGVYVFGNSKLAEGIFWVSGRFWGSWNGFWGIFKV